MMHLTKWFLLRMVKSVLSISILPTDCPHGYQSVGSTTCFQINLEVLTAVEAISANIWLGLVCYESDYTSCYTAAGDKLSSITYNNFYPGHPDPTLGNCVYMDYPSGYWYSGDCKKTRLAYGCLWDKSKLDESYCGTGYYLFSNPGPYYCYKTLPAFSEDVAEAFCNLECGNLASIGSWQENNFVFQLGQTASQEHVRIGLQSLNSTSYGWTDGTRLGFDNLGYRRPELGRSVVMSLINDVVNAGQWINYDCSKPIVSICKREQHAPCQELNSYEISCDPECTPYTTNYTCDPTSFYRESGNITSPGWPNEIQNQKLSCEYVITVDKGQHVALQPLEVQLSNATIFIYTDIDDEKAVNADYPFFEDGGYTSRDNTMKIRIISNEPLSNSSYLINYEPYNLTQSGCFQTGLTYNGTITSPYYPKNYFNYDYCEYAINTFNGYRILLQFNSFYTEKNRDFLTIYDGDSSRYSQIGRFSGNSLPQTVNSSSNSMFIQFSSDHSHTFSGFKATFTSFKV